MTSHDPDNSATPADPAARYVVDPATVPAAGGDASQPDPAAFATPSATAPAVNPPRWSGRKTAVGAALAIGFTSVGTVAAAAALPQGTGADTGGPGGRGPGRFGPRPPGQDGGAPQGGFQPGQFRQGQFRQGQVPQGQVPQGQLPQGHFPPGQPRRGPGGTAVQGT